MENHLKTVYGHNNFRPHQQEIITDILNKLTVSVILPTGGGKSLLYQFPATYMNKITVIISPLISLIKDQCESMESNGIRCINLSDSNSLCSNLETCRCDLCKCSRELISVSFIYATPEWISSRGNRLNKIIDKIILFAVDECHCISQWGHDFRESYQNIAPVLSNFKQIPLLLVTATATPKVLEDIYEILNIEEVTQYSLGTHRTNLSINVLDKSYWDHKIIDNKENTIIYTQTRKECEKLANDLTKKGIECLYYHAGLSDRERETSHTKFLHGEVNVIVATISFGMGIDKSDIRHVINYGVPTDIETYYQEIGRAGRDGLMSKATIFFENKDFSMASFLISKGSEKQLKQRLKNLNIFREYLNEEIMCRQYVIDYYLLHGKYPTTFDEKQKCNICDNCNGIITGVIYNIYIDAVKIVNILSKEPCALGITKTINLCKSIGPKEYIRSVILILAKEEYYTSYKFKMGSVI